MDNRLYIGNLSYRTTEEDLRDHFSQAGDVTSVTLIMDRETGRSKGFAFVEMASQTDAENAIRMFNGVELDGRALKVNIARPREERGPSRSGGGPRRDSFSRDRDGGGQRDRNRQRGGGSRGY